MGHRDVKHVPLDFDAPRGEVWAGYRMPDDIRPPKCEDCDGSGASPRARHLKDRWYGYVPFDPSETGSTPWLPSEPIIRERAERNVSVAPQFYGVAGSGELFTRLAVDREAQRLAGLFNRAWSHHLAQEDVDALIAAGRLMDFTHTTAGGKGWKPIEPTPTVTAAEVNRWSIGWGFGHDSINCWRVVAAACEREGASGTCARCHGHGNIATDEERDAYENWEGTEPPEGPGWQLWETVSEGSPQSPVFETPEALAAWCVDNATVFAGMKATYGEWLRMIVGDTLDVGSLMVANGGPPTFLQREGEMAAYDPDREGA